MISPAFHSPSGTLSPEHYHASSTNPLQYPEERGTETENYLKKSQPPLPSPPIILIPKDIIFPFIPAAPKIITLAFFLFFIFFTHNTNRFNMPNCHGIGFSGDRHEILTWLSPLEPHLRHHDIQTSRVNGVGDWLLRTQEFRGWRDFYGKGESQKATIFCSGNLGVGKTYIR